MQRTIELTTENIGCCYYVEKYSEVRFHLLEKCSFALKLSRNSVDWADFGYMHHPVTVPPKEALISRLEEEDATLEDALKAYYEQLAENVRVESEGADKPYFKLVSFCGWGSGNFIYIDVTDVKYVMTVKVLLSEPESEEDEDSWDEYEKTRHEGHDDHIADACKKELP